jgi:hypothetical protein
MASSKLNGLRHPIQWVKEEGRERFGDGDRPPGVRRRGFKKNPVDRRITPDFKAIGVRGGYFFLTDSSNFLKRHVETLQIKSASFARRRLTIDVQLPCDEDLGELGEDGEHVFWIPVTFLAKRPPRSNIDLRDDRNRVVPLLTRRENNEITRAAVMAAVRELLPVEPSRMLKALLFDLVTCDGMTSEVALVLAREALRAEGMVPDSEKALAFAESLRVLSGNYAAWVGFHGRPRERRVIKFHYDVEFERQRVLRQRRGTKSYVVYARRSEEVHELDVEEIGDKNPYSPVRRLAARAASATGLGAVNVGIESPYIVGSDSYHLQVESPPGVETRDIDLFADVDEEGDVDSWKRAHGAHLYVNGATQLAEEGAGIALLTLRIGRRGFMTLSWLSAVISAAILWLFYLTAGPHIESPEATAAVLLFGPALLAALVVRPGEHPVATKLFSGIRLLVALNGVLVVGAAAAVAGVTPEGWSVEHFWFIAAIAATASAAIVTLGWIFSWDTTYKLVKGLRRQLSTGGQYRRLCAWLLGLTGVVFAGGWLNQWIQLPPELYLAPALGLLLACGFVAAGYAGLQRSSALPAAVAIDLNCLALLAALLALALDLRSGFGWEAWWLRLEVVPLGGLLMLLLNDRRWKRRHAGRAHREVGDVEGRAMRLLRDTDPPNFLRATPSGARIREEARKNATGIPDLIAHSAYREVEPTSGLVDAAGEMYEKFLAARATRDLEAGRNGDGIGQETEESLVPERLEEGGREVVVLDL